LASGLVSFPRTTEVKTVASTGWHCGFGRHWVLGAALVLPVGCRGNAENPPLPESPPPSDQTARGQGSQGSVVFGKALVIFGADTVVAEVASTPEQRERGLMYRRELPDGTGMLFVFTEEQEITFWMSNTYVSLDVAFLDANLNVVDIQQMDAETTNYHDSRRPAMYGLEVPKGWLSAHGVKVGDRARLIVGAG
jgi:uncharacterized membrane protein (UPF0127 family)